MRENYKWLEEAANVTKDVLPEAFLLKSSTHGKYLDSFKLKPININYFQKKLESELVDLYEKYRRKDRNILNIYDIDDPQKEDAIVISMNDFEQAKVTVDKIFLNTDANPIDSLDTMQKAKFCAIYFEIPDNKSIIIFGSISLYLKNSKNIGLVTEYTEEGLKELENPVLTFNVYFPCIYFEEKEIIIFLDIKMGEKIFQLTEHHREISKSVFKRLEEEGLQIKQDVLDEELKNKTIVNNIAKLEKNFLFDKDINFYKKAQKRLTDEKVDDNDTHLKIVNDKIILDGKVEIKTFLNATEHNYVKSIMPDDDDTLYQSSSKHKVKKKIQKQNHTT